MLTLYEKIYSAAEFFNAQLFEGRLTLPLLTLYNERGTYGTFAADYLHKKVGEGKQSIINLNPSDFDRRIELVLSTLVHEMVHLEQHLEGKPGKGGYHNKEWVRFMERVGLIPVNNKNPNLQTGVSITHHILENGAFHLAVNELLASGWEELEWKEVDPTPERQARALAQRKTKYSCQCSPTISVWGRPGLHLFCITCSNLFQEA